MAKSRNPRTWLAWLLALSTLLLLAACKDSSSSQNQAAPVDLERLDWPQLIAAYNSMVVDPTVRESFAADHGSESGPAAIYLNGILLVESGQIREALQAFDTIPLDAIPPEHLYLPFRLQAELNPGLDNRYWPALFAVRTSNELGALIRARVHAMGGEGIEALYQYARTDPAEWRSLEVRIFQQLHLHAGLKSEADRLIVAAIKGGRIAGPLRDALLDVLRSANSEQNFFIELEAIERQLSQDPQLAEKVVRASVPLLEVQTLFLQQDFAEIVRRFGQMEPHEQADRMVVILFLSAAQLGDSAVLSRSGQELYRRYPTKEIKQWIDSIKSQVRASP